MPLPPPNFLFHQLLHSCTLTMAQVQCELAIIRATNLDLEHLPPGKLFVRYYVHAGGGRRIRIRIDTKEVSSSSDPYWDGQSSLECQVASEKVKDAMCEHNVVFELRWRGDKAIFGSRARSKLLGRAEVAWNTLDSTDMLTERRVSLVMKKPLTEGLKPAVLTVGMGIRVSVSQAPEKEKRRGEMGKCRCEGCRWIGSEEDVFVSATAGCMIDARQ